MEINYSGFCLIATFNGSGKLVKLNDNEYDKIAEKYDINKLYI